MMKQYGSASSPCTSSIRSTGPHASIALRVHNTSGESCAVGFSHSRFRLAPAAFVRRCPRTLPSGFMLGTTYTAALRSTFLATGSSASRSLRTKPSIHHDAMDSPGCCRPRIHTTRLAPPSRTHGSNVSPMAAIAATSSGDSPANARSGIQLPGSPNRRQSSGRPSRVFPSTTCDTDAGEEFDACAMRSRCFSYPYGTKYARWTQSPGTGSMSTRSSPSTYVVVWIRRHVFLSADTNAL
mmetsp:Transcript_10732/g.49392  ORF Transcript_10732/g.49392 Transcript_10732/m.49392 type:complete len:239 (-) Transcript_10732:398-1114(-)